MTLTLPVPASIGAPELKTRARSFLLLAWLLAASAHLVTITAIRVVRTAFPADARGDGHVTFDYVGPLPPPPAPITDVARSTAQRATTDAPAEDGAIEPVLDAATDATTSVGQGLVEDVGASGAVGAGGGDVISVPQASEPDPGTIWDLPGVDEPPMAVVAPHPEYPEWAIEAGIEGTVHVEAVVEKDGLIREAHVTRRSHTVLDDAALTAVLHSVWRPAMNRGRPVRVRIDVPIRFSLRDRF